MKPVPPPAAVGAPGTAPEDKPKKEKVKKSIYPGLINDEGVEVKLTAVPEDYDPKKHSLLKKKNFNDDSLFLEFQAAQLEKKAQALRSQATKLRELGNTASSGKLKTLLKMQERMNELMATLRAEGLDIDSMMNSNK